MAAFGEAFEAFDERVAKAVAKGEDRPSSDFLAASDTEKSRWNARIDAISGALNGARFSEVSSADYDAYRDTGVNWRVGELAGGLLRWAGVLGAGLLGCWVLGAAASCCFMRPMVSCGILARPSVRRGGLLHPTVRRGIFLHRTVSRDAFLAILGPRLTSR